jgi:hypothetical protein
VADTMKEAVSTYQREFAAAANLEEQQRAYDEFDKDVLRLHLEQLKELFLNGSRNPRARLDRGGPIALFQAIELCGRSNVPLPAWAASAFSKGFDRVLWAEVNTWDKAFGRPWPKGTKLIVARRHQMMMTRIYERVLALHDGRGGSPPRKIDNSLFEDVGKEFGIKRSLCSKLYLHERHRVGGLPYAVRVPRKR